MVGVHRSQCQWVVVVALVVAWATPADGAARSRGRRWLQISSESRIWEYQSDRGALIKGRVVSTDSPVPDADVTARCNETRSEVLTTTDRDGRFKLVVPAGRYVITVRKTGFVTMQYGQKTVDHIPLLLEVSDGGLYDIDFVLPTGGVVSGRVFDQDGRVVIGIRVQALRSASGATFLSPASSATTDDRGEYRLFGLSPGEYYIAVVPVPPSTSLRSPPVKSHSTMADARGTTFYPAASSAAAAQRLTIRSGTATVADITIWPRRLVKISGVALDSAGSPMNRGSVTLLPGEAQLPSLRRDTTTANDGTFTLTAIEPGLYTLRASRRDLDGSMEVGFLQVTAEDEDLTRVSIRASPPVLLSGRLVSERPEVPVPRGVRIGVIPTSSRETPVSIPPVAVDADGRFAIKAPPGRIRFLPYGLPATWTLKQVVLRGADVTDDGVSVGSAGDLSGFEVKVTDAVSIVRGTVLDRRGNRSTGYVVFVYARDSSRWTVGDRYRRSARPDQNGLFEVRGLPGGQYLVVAVDQLPPAGIPLSEFLERLRSTAVSVRIRDGETLQLTLTLKTLPPS